MGIKKRKEVSKKERMAIGGGLKEGIKWQMASGQNLNLIF